MTKVVVDMEEMHDVDETAQLLNKGVATIWRWIRDGKIKASKVAGRTLIHNAEVERLKSMDNGKSSGS